MNPSPSAPNPPDGYRPSTSISASRYVKDKFVAKLDDAQYRYQLERAEAALRQAKASIGLDPNSPATPGASDQTPAMRQAEAQMEDARFKFRNAQKLVKSGDISQEHFNELEKAFGAREAAYEETRNAMLTQFANFDALKADIDLARKHVDDCTVRAPVRWQRFGSGAFSRTVREGKHDHPDGGEIQPSAPAG